MGKRRALEEPPSGGEDLYRDGPGDHCFFPNPDRALDVLVRAESVARLVRLDGERVQLAPIITRSE